MFAESSGASNASSHDDNAPADSGFTPWYDASGYDVWLKAVVLRKLCQYYVLIFHLYHLDHIADR